MKDAILKDDKAICEQDHCESKQLLWDDFACNMKKPNATRSMKQSISSKRLRLPSGSTRNPTSIYSGNLQASTSTTHL